MQKILRKGLIRGLLAVALVCSGCGVVSEHPVALLSESDPLPDYLLGSWQALEVAGQEVEPGSGIVGSFDQRADGSVRITLLGKGDPQEINTSLAILGGRHILSLATAPDDPSWLIVNLVHEELADTLTVEILGHDVDSELTASTAGLRSYFSEYGQAFNVSILVLERVSEEAE